MSSQKQIAANRRNSLKSTGPVSADGKSASSQNAVKTGLYAKSAVMKGEKADEYQALLDEYYTHHRPDSPELRSLVDQLVHIEWEMRRLARVSAQMWDYQIGDSWTADKDKFPMGKAATTYNKAWGVFQRRMDSLQRNQSRLLDLLRQHRANPIPIPTPAIAEEAAQPLAGPLLTLCPVKPSDENGFVSASSAPLLPEPAESNPEPPQNGSDTAL